ncbi:MAG TPA: hypothetical protein V6C71_27035 [Coleofasciculaceae cyanobacterium]|jgi:hypothetical protein
MGNWHCIPSGCAEVVYQEYLPPSVRWRYGSEPWQEIDGDDYSINKQVANPYDYLSSAQIYKLLEPLHSTGGLARYFSFVHIDWRDTKARW